MAEQHFRTHCLGALLCAAALVLTLAACSSGPEAPAASTSDPTARPARDDEPEIKNPGYIVQQQFPTDTMEVSSTVFSRIRRMPIEYTCTDNEYYPESGFDFRYGQEKSPPLAWTGAPEGTVSFALVMDDPDVAAKDTVVGGRWVHWTMWNIPADVTELAEHIATTTEVASIGPNTRQGVNDYGNIGWNGPCPGENISAIQGSAGRNINTAHKYTYTLYALDVDLDLPGGSSHQDLLKAMDGHILAAGSTVGEYINKKIFR
jgi:Raf kinase inhibitor-like YbhB/YbcL family protein